MNDTPDEATEGPIAGTERRSAAMEAELEDLLIQSGRGGRWLDLDLLNKPFTIWLLTTIMISLIGFAYTNYSACRLSIASDEDHIERLSTELEARALYFYAAWNSHALTSGNANPGTTGIALLVSKEASAFSEFQGKPLKEIAFAVQQLFQKWEGWTPNKDKWFVKNAKTKFLSEDLDPNGIDPFGSRYVSWLIDNSESINTSLHDYLIPGFDRTVIDKNIEDVVPVLFDAALAVRHRREVGFLPRGAALCVRRSLWPF
jgi:hypothetical protein